MHPSLALALSLALISASLEAAPQLVPLSVVELRSEAEEFGGFSGLEVSEDGRFIVAISDTGLIYHGEVRRDASRHSMEVDLNLGEKLKMEGGTQPDAKKLRDTEGLALAPDGTMFIAAESVKRLLTYAPHMPAPKASELPDLPAGASVNAGFEALALGPDGALYTLPESSGSLIAPFAVMRRISGRWHTVHSFARGGGFRPVGADFGPDGHLYILSRAFNGFAFASRIDRLVFEGDRVIRQDRLFSGHYGQFDNLEGLAIWQTDGQKLRALAISDDNFSRLQRTQIVEFELKE